MNIFSAEYTEAFSAELVIKHGRSARNWPVIVSTFLAVRLSNPDVDRNPFSFRHGKMRSHYTSGKAHDFPKTNGEYQRHTK
jgi:hypothetical protein